MASQQPCGIHDHHNLRPQPAGPTLPVQSIRVEPKEYFGIDQPIPFRRFHPYQTRRQRVSRHWLLIAKVCSIRQLEMAHPLALFQRDALLSMDSGQIQESTRAE